MSMTIEQAERILGPSSKKADLHDSIQVIWEDDQKHACAVVFFQDGLGGIALYKKFLPKGKDTRPWDYMLDYPASKPNPEK
jgi:hypothetical protein